VLELGTYEYNTDIQHVLGARLISGDTAIARTTLWPEPLKYLTLLDPGISTRREGDILHLRAERPAKGVWLSAGDGITWSDNMFDLMPGDEYQVVATGLGTRDLSIKWLT
jgi:beta-mannosidase